MFPWEASCSAVQATYAASASNATPAESGILPPSASAAESPQPPSAAIASATVGRRTPGCYSLGSKKGTLARDGLAVSRAAATAERSGQDGPEDRAHPRN